MKWMPAYQAIIISGIAFGCAHLTLKDLPYLTVTGYSEPSSLCVITHADDVVVVFGASCMFDPEISRHQC